MLNIKIMSYKAKMLLPCILLVTIGGCSSAPSKEQQSLTNQLDIVDLKRQLQEHKGDWEEVRPGIRRLIAMESDLKTLIGELSQLAALPDVPQRSVTSNVVPSAAVPYSKPAEEVVASSALKPFSSPDADSIIPSNSNEISPTGASVGDSVAQVDMPEFGIHLVSFKNEERLKRSWMGLEGSFNSRWPGKSPLMQRVAVRGADYYRLIVGPFAGHDNAKAVCDELKRSKQYCSVTSYTGEPM